jgi:mannitol-1-phosphate 5-dehydrogenase
VRALHAQTDRQAVVEALARCAFAATAVGVNVFAHLGDTLAAGIAARARFAEQHIFNVLCAENQKNASDLLRQTTLAALPPRDRIARRYLANQTGFVDLSVGRMVPVQTTETRAEDPLLIVAEPYRELPFDGAAWLGPVPDIAGLLPKPNFAGYVARKLFTHNGGHAQLAYQGASKGHEYVWQCAEDDELVAELRGAWGETGTALVKAYNLDKAEQRAHEDDLLRRFRNRVLGDTVTRVARDPARKLRSDDRLVGAALLCLEHNIMPVHVCRAIAGSLRYGGDPDDPSAARVQAEVRRGGVRGALQTLSGLRADSPLVPLIETAYADQHQP